jgi:L-ribulose-5-phosphate 3-epimerase UlaE
MRHAYNVHHRDTNQHKLHVRDGQGEVEYTRLITQLAKLNYHRAQVVHITEMEEVDHAAELRKMRLLLESMM